MLILRMITGKKVPAPDSVKAWAREANINDFAAEGLHSKLRRLFNAPYIVEQPAANALKQMIDNLDYGQHVVLSFGEYEKDLDYLFVSNLITRRIREVGNSGRTHSAVASLALWSPGRW